MTDSERIQRLTDEIDRLIAQMQAILGILKASQQQEVSHGSGGLEGGQAP